MAYNAVVHVSTLVFVCLQAFSLLSRFANATPAFLVTRDESLHPSIPDRNLTVGPCTWIIDHKCPDDDNIQVYLFTRRNPNDRQRIHIDESWEASNLSTSFFNPADPVKIIIHGYNSDMFLSALLDMKDEYLQRGNYNLFYIDWSSLAPGPCYLSAVHNAKHTGVCIAELVKRILESGMDDIHLIGFSLGAHVTNFVAQSVRPFDIPRISGLDPAMPLYITASADNKLDASDAKFVDVIHTNALIQGKIERCGHVDFYMNGGVIQPGCSKGGSNPFACSHHRAPDYYSESIRSYRGFWGWPCTSYVNYLLGLCPKTDRVVVAGEDCVSTTRGMFLVTTNSETPFASGRWTDLPVASTNGRIEIGAEIRRPLDPTMQSLDEWGKLEGAFNNRQRPGAMIGFEEMADFQWDQILANDVDGTTTKPPTSTTIRYPLKKKSQFLTAFSNADETNVVNGEPISKENFLALYHQLFGKSAAL